MKKILIFVLVFFISQNVSAATSDFLKESTDTTCVSVSGRSAQAERVVGDFKLVRTCIGTVWSDAYTIKGKAVSKTSFYRKYGEYLATESYTPISPKVTSVSGEGVKTFDNRPALERHKKKILKLKQCGNGNDFYDGGEDTDTVIYTGNRDQFFITQHSDGSYTFKDLIQCGSDTDTVINFEKFEFSNRILTLKDLNPDAVATTSEKATSITLTTPKSKKLNFALGETIPVGWKVKNAPQNSQVEYSIIKISEEKSGSSYEGPGGVSGQSGKLKKSSGKGSKNVATGSDSIASLGTYRIDAVVKACGTTCNFETYGMVNYPNITYAVAEPIVIQLVEKKAVSTKSGVSYNGFESVQVNEKTLITDSDPASTFTIKGTVSSSITALTVAIVESAYEGTGEWSSVGGLLKDGSGYIATSNTAKIKGGDWSVKFGNLPSGYYHIFIYDSGKTLMGEGTMISN